MINARTIKPGTLVHVLPHVRHTHLSGGAEITPTIPHDLAGYNTSVQSVLQDEMEGEDGVSVMVYIIVTKDGKEYDPAELELIEG